MMDEVKKSIAVVLPSLDPDKKFAGVVSGLIDEGFEHIVIVDDGSDANHQEPFRYAASFPQCHIIVHEVNKGKGRALKDAFSYIHENLPDIKGAVTIDGDGQHLTKDIVKCCEVMLEKKDVVILGSRDFDQAGVPTRSVAGNKFTAKMFKILFGIDINDTQTGLRAIPAQYLEAFSQFTGERFEYETNMLLQMKQLGIEFFEQSIETVYDPEDYSSHYNAFRDSLKVGKVMLAYLVSGLPFRYVISSLISVLIDNGFFWFASALFGVSKQLIVQPVCTLLSSLFNFNLNKFWVFKSKKEYFKEFLQYYCVFIPRTAVSVFLTHYALTGLSVSAPSLATLIKLIVDLALFIACYFIQKVWVFKNE